MGYRTLEISNAAEIHIKEGQLEVTTEEGVVFIPIEDLYLPTAIVLPFWGHARQSKMMHAQVNVEPTKYLDLWVQIIKKKISNQARVLSILGLSSAEKVAAFVEKVTIYDVDSMEALAAKEYFASYHEGLNRRVEDPINSRLNYGYAVVRSAIARNLVAVGFHPTFGIHHDSQLNAFNLVDDLIEPYRAIVDLVVHNNIGSNVQLNKAERKEIAHVLHNACMMDGVKVNVLTSINMMCESLKRIVLEELDEKLLLPTVLPIESMEGITE